MKTRSSLATRYAVIATAAVGALALAACSNDATGTADDVAAATPSATTTTTTVAAPFGPGCAGLPASGPGSVAAIATEPVATAASQNPQLSTLVTAVTKAGLADTLNSTEGITVFAPTNDAFAKIPPATLAAVLADKKALTDILTYHVVSERRTSADLGSGQFTTLQGGTITTAGSGDTFTANDARIVCGDLQTRNATVHVIDTVLMPEK
jgi:uncharacterized surface protein with fasciclin (FAS1) repeats